MATIFESMKINDSGQITIDEVHRLKYIDKSKPNHVIVRFLKRTDRNKVWKTRHPLPNHILSTKTSMTTTKKHMAGLFLSLKPQRLPA